MLPTHLPLLLLALPFGAPFSPPTERVAVLSATQDSRPTSRPARAAFDHGHRAFDRLLSAVVDDRGRVDYVALKERRAELDAYLWTLEAVQPKSLASWTREQRMAFWINAYNGFTLSRIVSRYPVKSIKDIGSSQESVWDQRFIRMPVHHPKGRELKLSLNDVEHEILRVRFEDPRIHAAVNCAAASCPALPARAFTAQALDRQLDERTRAWLADESLNRYDARTKTLRLSKIFSWFTEDFGGDKGLRDFVARYGPQNVRGWAKDARRIEYLEYDWALNEQRE